jgi:pre-mRNA-processing factor 8
MEIQAPSAQRQQMADIEKSTEASAQVTAVKTQTTNIHGDVIQTVTSTQYEVQTFASKSDWRVRAISATNLPLRTNHLFVGNDDVKDDAGSYTFVMPKNILRTFIVSGDLRTQVVGYLFGSSPADNSQVKEIKAIAWIPQRGTATSVELPLALPKHEFLLKGLEPLGWIKTQSQELNHLAPADLTTQAKIMAANPEWGPNSICITCAFTPGSVSLNAWEITVAGFEWGRKNEDVTGANAGFNASMANRVQLLLSDRILGSTLVPEGGAWNYGVGLTQSWTDKIAYNMTLDRPENFWAAIHRPSAFLNFATMEGSESADVENVLE